MDASKEEKEKEKRNSCLVVASFAIVAGGILQILIFLDNFHFSDF